MDSFIFSDKVILETLTNTAKISLATLNTYVEDTEIMLLPKGSSIQCIEYALCAENSNFLNNLNFQILLNGKSVSNVLTYVPHADSGTQSHLMKHYFSCSGEKFLGMRIKVVNGAVAVRDINVTLQVVQFFER